MYRSIFSFSRINFFRRLLIINFSFLIIFSSCSLQNQIDKTAKLDLINTPELQSANIGICIYDPLAKKYLYNFNSNKYFTPASNTKILTCYAAMKYLGDSLEGLRVADFKDSLLIFPTGDPTLLHADFKQNPVIDFLEKQKKPFIFYDSCWKEKALGPGWAWDDYQYDWSAERSALPVYGNIISIKGNAGDLQVIPSFFRKDFSYISDTVSDSINDDVSRKDFSNNFMIDTAAGTLINAAIPFVTGDSLSLQLLTDSIHKNIIMLNRICKIPAGLKTYIVHSQPTDSLLKIMMHRSDNFYAEQSLLMVSNLLLGEMNDEKIIDTLLQKDFNGMPQKPDWVDGSGLSRYNLMTPQDFVYVLNKMRTEFAWNRITTIFPSGGNGTLSNFYENIDGKIFAKTGSLSNNISISGFIVKPGKRTLIFSVLVGNFTTDDSNSLHAVEKFLTSVIDTY